ncbi:bifunctional ADP-heptose synthase [Cytophagales bacterium LB-30]|uniref:Bifunctional ADP-heptose synthase n=1 Tax=Shiella aurantiaca TaxID=3058365 RepID=A0ABT8F7H0_9BACT|nr:bifunctional ADP-heptose synthase [Shiella aurantiaca]MDN4166382.1 bifunctional ADP-heptose synthase [Shiella aurantiaca]
MTFTSLDDIFAAFSPLRVLIIGDVMIDSYVWGKVERISPEAPVPVVRVTKKEKRLGGAANVALNVQAMGAQPILCSIIGDDQDGEEFFHLLHKQQIPSNGIIKSKERMTTVKERVISGSQQLVRVDSETDKDLSPLEEKTLLSHIINLLKEADVVIFEDYDKGALNPSIIHQTIAKARELGVPTVVDPKKRNFLAYNQATVFKPNLKELKEGLKVEFGADDFPRLLEATHRLQQELQADTVMVTLSERGVLIKDAKDHHHLPAHVRNIADVSGAGDTVVSIAALCTALKLPSPFVAGLSNLGGGLVCEKVGVVPIDKQALLAEAQKHALNQYL